jgi:hypothetical protein
MDRVKALLAYEEAKRIGLPVTFTQVFAWEGVLPALEPYQMPGCAHCNGLVEGSAACRDCGAEKPILETDMIIGFNGGKIHSRATQQAPRLFLHCACGSPWVGVVTWATECFSCMRPA